MPEIPLYARIKLGLVEVGQKSPMEWRFWKRVDKNGPIHPIVGRCWNWLGARLRPGSYGKFTGGLAHRYSWKLSRGRPIPEGKSVLHRCDNPQCANPEHLFLGTQQDNLEDMREKGNQVRGESQGASLLTEEEVVEIRRRYCRYSHQSGTGALAKEFKVSAITIYKVVKRYTWRHV